MKLAVGLALVLAALAAPAHAATAPELARTLGRQGIVDIDPGSGRPRVVARLDGYLTGPSRAAPERIALDYLRAHADVFGLDGDDLDGVRLTGSYLSRGRIHHLTFEQRAGNVPVLDGRLVANVAVDGRLLNLLGAPRPDVDVPGVPALAAPTARKRAAAAAGGSAGEPELVLLDGRLGWRALVETAAGEAREVIVDAGDGRTLQDRSLRHDAKARIFDTAPGRALGGTQRSVELGAYVTQPGGAQLHGPYASVWADEDDDDHVDAGEDIPPSSGSDYEFTYTPFQTVAGVTCSAPAFCSWDRNQAFSWRTNRNEAAVNVFWHANRFHDHLANAAIDFTPAKGAFEGADAVLINVADGAALAAGLPDADHRNNAYNQTLPTGPARLTFLLDTTHSLNYAEDAATIYHEYAHGLSQRLMLGALDGQQSDSLGEAWSDWYAVDYLSRSGFAPDTATPGELTIGSLGRSQPMDCPVGAAAPACPGTAAAGPGGYTYGDFGKIDSDGPEPHADGEIWAETLWDLRRRLIARYGSPLGIDVAEVLVTGGMELAPGDPTFLDMRNAIVEADVAFNDRDDGDLVWSAFAARGMGFFAAAIDSRDVRPVEDFSLLPPDNTPTGDLTGRVLTEAGLPVPGARVTVAGLRGYAVCDGQRRGPLDDRHAGGRAVPAGLRARRRRARHRRRRRRARQRRSDHRARHRPAPRLGRLRRRRARHRRDRQRRRRRQLWAERRDRPGRRHDLDHGRAGRRAGREGVDDRAARGGRRQHVRDRPLPRLRRRLQRHARRLAARGLARRADVHAGRERRVRAAGRLPPQRRGTRRPQRLRRAVRPPRRPLEPGFLEPRVHRGEVAGGHGLRRLRQPRRSLGAGDLDHDRARRAHERP